MTSNILVKYVTLDAQAQPDPVLMVQLSPGRCEPLEAYCRRQGVEPIDLMPVEFASDRYVCIFRRPRPVI